MAKESPDTLPARRSSMDDVIDAYKKDIDRTLLRENLKMTVEQRIRQLGEFARFAEQMREAGRRAFG